jgi:hypothetical protein
MVGVEERVMVGVWVGVEVGVWVIVMEGVEVGVLVEVMDEVTVGVGVMVGVEVTLGEGVMVGVGDRVKVKVGEVVFVGERVKVPVGVRQLDRVTSLIYQPLALLEELSALTTNWICIDPNVTEAKGTCSKIQPPEEVEEVDQRVSQLLLLYGAH